MKGKDASVRMAHDKTAIKDSRYIKMIVEDHQVLVKVIFLVMSFPLVLLVGCDCVDGRIAIHVALVLCVLVDLCT